MVFYWCWSYSNCLLRKKTFNNLDKMKRQGLIVSIKELNYLINDLLKQALQMKVNYALKGHLDELKWQINIINKRGLSDTWEIEK